nr:P4 [Lettuce chlorosis virus]
MILWVGSLLFYGLPNCLIMMFVTCNRVSMKLSAFLS